MKTIRIGLTAAAAMLLAACQTVSSDVPRASATLEPTRGSTVRGTASFAQMGGKVRVVARISGLKPNGEFGFHIHEVGDCSSGDGMSTKGHFNPYAKPHSRAGMAERHAGDLPSLRSDASGNATLDTDVDVITVSPGPASIVDRGLSVRAQADDYQTQPTGNAGARRPRAVI